jgi:hypothetical protein
MSVFGTIVILSLSGSFSGWGSPLKIAVLIPLIIAPLMSAFQLKFMTQLDKERQEKEELVNELQETLANVKTLKGLIPICAACKKVRDDEGFWQQLEDYIHHHSDAVLSHGYCPDCAHKIKAEVVAMKETITENS